MAEIQFVRLHHDGTIYEIQLLDTDGNQVGHGYRGPTRHRAEQDVKYWTRTKGLILVDSQEANC